MFDSVTSALTVTEGASSATIVLGGSYTGEYFHVASGGPGLGTKVTVDTNPACFCAGTVLQTFNGAVAVEDLVKGAMLLTLVGAPARRVRWVGRRATATGGHSKPWDVQPVRVSADAFAPGMPSRDVWLSPDHAVFVSGHLMPVHALINGATIVQEVVEKVVYYHVELASATGEAVHDVLLASGLPVESFLDAGNRGAFENGGDVVMAHPEFARRVWERSSCAPLAVSGPVVRDVQRTLLARAETMGFALTDDADLCLLADDVLVRPTMQGDVARFCLASPATSLRLVSRVWVPAQVDPDSDDWRGLGVAFDRSGWTARSSNRRPLTMDGWRRRPVGVGQMEMRAWPGARGARLWWYFGGTCVTGWNHR